PYSWRISTPLSNFEAGLNYKQVQDPSLTVRLKADDGDYFFLAWTTTPWTLPSNLALSVGPDIDYVQIKDKASGSSYVIAKERLGAYYKKPDEYEVVREMKGSALEGKSYQPLFPYFQDRKAKGAFR